MKQMVDCTEINRKQYWYRRKTLLVRIENSTDTYGKWYRYIAKIVSIQMENNID